MSENQLGQFVETTLTNLRVRQRYKNLVKSALLSRIDGIALVYRSHPLWLVAAVIVMLGSLGMASGETAMLGPSLSSERPVRTEARAVGIATEAKPAYKKGPRGPKSPRLNQRKRNSADRR